MSGTDHEWKIIEGRVIEMAETLRRLPADRGPKAYGNAMPEIVRKYDEAYPKEAMRYFKRPKGVEIDRMEECFGWINRFLEEPQRKLLYAWAHAKVRKGIRLSSIAEENSMNSRFLRREIHKYCQIIVDSLGRLLNVRTTMEDLPLSEDEAQSDQSHVNTKICAEKSRSGSSWMAFDAKPVHDPNSPELASLIERIETGNEERREREARRRAKLEREEAA